MFPLACELGPPARRTLAALAALVAALTAAVVAAACGAVAWPSDAVSGPDWLLSAGFVASAVIAGLRAGSGIPDRRPWRLLTGTVACSAVAWSLWLLRVSHSRALAIPSVCDVFWLAGYPFAFATALALARPAARRNLPAGVWLDGLIAGAGMAALGGALLLPPAVASASGRAVAVATELAYPVIDMMLLAVLFGVLGVRGWRWDRRWALITAAFVLGVSTDVAEIAGIAHGSSVFGHVAEVVYLIEVELLALSGWQPSRDSVARQLENWTLLLLPCGFTVGSVAVLVYNEFHRLPAPIFVLSIVTLLAASTRMAFAYRDMLSLADVRRQAFTDDLTTLPNRRQFMQRLRQAVSAAGQRGVQTSVMMLDLDDFKQLNDTLGHSAGDEVLRMVGPRLRAVLRATDVVARLGGDEFAILLDPVTDSAGLERVAEAVLAALREPFDVRGLALRLHGSLGIACFPEHAKDHDQLLKCADVAMYLAKQSRRGWELYASERDTNSKERLVLASDLANALERGQIVAHFQPIADARTGAILGAEALVRWRRPDGSMLAPGEFVTAAEQTGLSRPLTRRVLMLALEQVAGWRAAGDELYVSVNTTVADLLDMSFPEEVAVALDLHGVPPEALVLEVTESSILSDPVRIGVVLAAIREQGVQIALDDFGTGYSSLAHLRNLAVDQVKIDRSFVSGMADCEVNAAIVYATIELVHKLGLTVVGEGVEDDRTWAELRSLHCDRIQGYGIGRPVAPAEFEPLLAAARGRPVPGPAPIG